MAPGLEMTETGFRIGIASRELEVRAALGELRKRLGALGLGEGDCGTVEIVLGEVLNNVVEHAYGAGRAGPVEIFCRPGAAGLFFDVRDGGQPMPGLRLPPGDPPDPGCARDDTPEGGFGWFLVRSLATGLAYRRAGRWNLLEFEIPLQVVPCPEAGRKIL